MRRKRGEREAPRRAARGVERERERARTRPPPRASLASPPPPPPQFAAGPKSLLPSLALDPPNPRTLDSSLLDTGDYTLNHRRSIPPSSSPAREADRIPSLSLFPRLPPPKARHAARRARRAAGAALDAAGAPAALAAVPRRRPRAQRGCKGGRGHDHHHHDHCLPPRTAGREKGRAVRRVRGRAPAQPDPQGRPGRRARDPARQGRAGHPVRGRLRRQGEKERRNGRAAPAHLPPSLSLVATRARALSLSLFFLSFGFPPSLTQPPPTSHQTNNNNKTKQNNRSQSTASATSASSRTSTTASRRSPTSCC